MRTLSILLVMSLLLLPRLALGQSSGTQNIQVGSRVQGVFTTNLPLDHDHKPYIDYSVNITSAGRYTIELDSANINVYDPYIILLHNGSEVGSDDDGGKGPLQSRLTIELQPGTYTIRVTRFGGGQLQSATQFELSLSRER
jgi:hypothetical protein